MCIVLVVVLSLCLAYELELAKRRRGEKKAKGRHVRAAVVRAVVVTIVVAVTVMKRLSFCMPSFSPTVSRRETCEDADGYTWKVRSQKPKLRPIETEFVFGEILTRRRETSAVLRSMGSEQSSKICVFMSQINR